MEIGNSRGVGQLLRDVADDGAHLARQEVHLARIEFAQIARDIGKGTGFAVAAAMVGLLTVQIRRQMCGPTSIRRGRGCRAPSPASRRLSTPE
jgi:hypothetical protein